MPLASIWFHGCAITFRKMLFILFLLRDLTHIKKTHEEGKVTYAERCRAKMEPQDSKVEGRRWAHESIVVRYSKSKLLGRHQNSE